MNTVQKKLPEKRDLVLGLGSTGLSVARFLKRRGMDAMFHDTREAPPGKAELETLWPGARLSLGDAALPEDIGRVIASPGIPDRNPLIASAREAGIEVVSDIELFVHEARAPFVAVTGSNGKSTVTTLIHKMCLAAGRDARAGGNLGVPALDLLGDGEPELYVLELSSFQLQRTKTLPAEVAVLLNVAPDHLDWHASEAEYREAKYRIYRQAEAAVVNRADPRAAEAAGHIGRVLTFGLDAPPEGQFGLIDDDGEIYLARGDTPLLSIRDLALFGVHNQANALAALAAGELIGLDVPSMLQVLTEFPGLPHRMQLVRSLGDVDYVNDSKATNVAAAVASIRSVDGMLVLIAGGDGKGGNFDELAQALEGRLRGAVLIGKDADRIAQALGPMPHVMASDMQDAVDRAAGLAESGDTVLLAPACASLDQYANYAARGDAFREAVGRLGR